MQFAFPAYDARTHTRTFNGPLSGTTCGWLGSRVVSVLDSGAEGPGFKSLSGNCLRQTVHTHCASVHQAAKLVAAVLEVAGVTAGLAESNGSLPPGLLLPRTGISSGTLRSVIECGLFFYPGEPAPER